MGAYNPRNDAALLALQGDDDEHVEAWHWRNAQIESDASVRFKREREATPAYQVRRDGGGDIGPSGTRLEPGS